MDRGITGMCWGDEFCPFPLHPGDPLGWTGQRSGAWGRVPWVGPEVLSLLQVMLLKPGDPIGHGAGCRGCPEPSSLPWRGEVGAVGLPCTPQDPPAVWPLLMPSPFALFAFVFHTMLFFALRTGRAKPAGSSPVPPCSLASPRISRPLPPGGCPCCSPGTGTRVVTLSRWRSELPASAQGALG